MNNEHFSGSVVSGRRSVSRAVVGALLSLFLVSACSKGSKGGEGTEQVSAPSADTQKVVKLAFVTNNTAEFWRIAAAGVKKYENEAKVQVDVKMPPNGTTEEQNQILENLVSQGYDAIAVSPIAPNDQVPVLDRIAQKTKLLTFDSDAPNSKRLL